MAATFAVFCVTSLPRLALACPVCFSEANAGVLRTYYFTTVLLSVLPLLLIGTIGIWLYRRQAAPAGRDAEAVESQSLTINPTGS